VSTRTHPLTPHPAYTPNPTLPLGLRGDHRDPRTIASDSPLEPAGFRRDEGVALRRALPQCPLEVKESCQHASGPSSNAEEDLTGC
jgi:hypothetical protein